MAGDISAMPSTELLMPINRVLFPAFVRVKEDTQELKRVFLLAQGVQILIAMPASAGLALVAPEIILLMLGEKWLIAVPFVQIFAVASLATAMLSSANYLMITLGHVKALALFSWAQVVLFALLAFALFPSFGARQIAGLRLWVSIASDVLFAALLLRFFPALRLMDLVRGVVRPVLAVGAMAICLQALGALWASPSPLVSLAAKTLLGVGVYTTMVVLLWWAAGRPAGAEICVLNALKKMLLKQPIPPPLNAAP